MKVLNYQEESEKISNWIRQTVHNAGFSDVVIAVSGGVDSATSLFLAVKALGKEHVYAVFLPYGDMGKAALEHGKLAIERVGLAKDHVFVRDIQSGVDTLQQQVNGTSDVRKGNMMARVRMIYVFDLAKSLSALVIGTENKSEHYLGYFTRFGDEASDIEPIRGLYKTQVWEMAKYLGVPQEIVAKAPSAGLWENQSDEGEFGFSYVDADKVLYHYFEEKLPPEGIVDLGIDKKLVENVLDFVEKNNFKHHTPYTIDE